MDEDTLIERITSAFTFEEFLQILMSYKLGADAVGIVADDYGFSPEEVQDDS